MSSNLILAVRRYLASDSTLTSLLGNDSKFATWIFQGTDAEAAPLVTMERTQEAAVVVWRSGSWTSPNDHNTMQFPQLSVLVYLDPPRDASGNVTTSDFFPLFQPIFDSLDRLLHLPQHGEIVWDDLRVLHSIKLQEWDLWPFAQTDGVRVARATFGITLG